MRETRAGGGGDGVTSSVEKAGGEGRGKNSAPKVFSWNKDIDGIQLRKAFPSVL